MTSIFPYFCLMTSDEVILYYVMDLGRLKKVKKQ